jgi:Ca2+-binding RTX toxin-like protein
MMNKPMLALCGAAVFAFGAVVESAAGGTYAAVSDSTTLAGNQASAATWNPDVDIPAECGPAAQYAGVVYGTDGNDNLAGGNTRQVIFGLGGDDTLRGGNSGDCLVGGDGNDQIYGGNAKDVLLGGDGDDLLIGGNGKDLLDGAAGTDVCDGGNGKDTLIGCETAP